MENSNCKSIILNRLAQLPTKGGWHRHLAKPARSGAERVACYSLFTSANDAPPTGTLFQFARYLAEVIKAAARGCWGEWVADRH